MMTVGEAGVLLRPVSTGFGARAQGQLGPVLKKLGGFATVGLAIGGAVKASINFESAFAGVRKTVNASEAELSKLRSGIRDMAKELPASTTEISAVAEAAGQLGVKKENILSFTRTMIDLGETTNLTSDQAATALARLANVMGTNQKDFDRLGSTIVDLGNNGASTESEITELGQRLAAAGKIVGLAEHEVLGFASALSSVGIEAEAGGTAFSKVFTELANAASRGGKELAGFAKVAGTSSSAFQKLFKKDAGEAIIQFVEGLGRIKKEGGNVFEVLDKLGIKEIRMRNALLSAANAGGLMRDSLKTGAKAWKENTALTEEARKRYETTAAKLKIVKNQVIDLGISIGDRLLPMISKTIKFFQDLSPGAASAAKAVGATAASLYLLVKAASAVTAVKTAFNVFGLARTSAVPATAAISTFGSRATSVASFMGGPWGIAIGLGAAALGIFSLRNEAAKRRVDDLTTALIANKGAILEVAEAEAKKRLTDKNQIDDLNNAGVTVKEFTKAVVEQRSALAESTLATARQADSTGNFARTALKEQAFELRNSNNAFDKLIAKLILAGQLNPGLAQTLIDLSGELGTSAQKARELALFEQEAIKSTGGLAAKLKDAGMKSAESKPLIDGYAKALKESTRFEHNSVEQKNFLIASLQRMADKLKGPARQAIIDHINEIRRIPRTRATKFTVDNKEALKRLRETREAIVATGSAGVRIIPTGQGRGVIHSGGYITSGRKIRRFHSGGLARDEMPAILQTREGVLNRRAMSIFGEQNLHALNKGNLPKLGGGGVGSQITIQQNFYGPTNAEDVERATRQIVEGELTRVLKATSRRARAGRVPA